MDEVLPARKQTTVERVVEQTIFTSRWLLAPSRR
jgi:hypothetical protein